LRANNDKVGQYYENLPMPFLFIGFQKNPQILAAILAAILDSEQLLK